MVLLPIISFDSATMRLIEREDTKGSLQSITELSILKILKAIKEEFTELVDPRGARTKVIVYNLQKNNDNKHEPDLESDAKDINNSEYHNCNGVETSMYLCTSPHTTILGYMLYDLH